MLHSLKTLGCTHAGTKDFNPTLAILQILQPEPPQPQQEDINFCRRLGINGKWWGLNLIFVFSPKKLPLAKHLYKVPTGAHPLSHLLSITSPSTWWNTGEWSRSTRYAKRYTRPGHIMRDWWWCDCMWLIWTGEVCSLIPHFHLYKRCPGYPSPDDLSGYWELQSCCSQVQLQVPRQFHSPCR